MATDLAVVESSTQAITITPVGLTIDRDVSFEHWAAFGARLSQLERAMPWVWGEWLLWGEGHYGHEFSQALDHVSYNPQTLSHYAWVCEQVAKERRRPSLSFSHHYEVAGLSPSEQTAWLRRSEEESWTRQQLRQALHPRPSQDVTVILTVVERYWDEVMEQCQAWKTVGRVRKVRVTD